MSKILKYATPIAEVFSVILVGNILASLVLSQILDPALMNQTPTADTNFFQMAGVTSTSMIFRFGFMIVIAFFIYKLWHRDDRKQIFKTWGISTGGRSTIKLVGMGILLWAVTILPLQILFTIDQVIPIGEGLPIWELQDEIGLRTDLLVFFLFTSIIIPPLLEETIARGYTRSRIADSYGQMGGIILSAFIFTLAHGQYFEGNLLLASVLPIIIYATICWAFVTWKTGSIIPAIIAHAIMNTPFPRNLTSFSVILVIMIVLIILYLKQVKSYFNSFFDLWKQAAEKGAILLGALTIAAILASIVFVSAMRMIWLGIFLVVTLIGHVMRSRKSASLASHTEN